LKITKVRFSCSSLSLRLLRNMLLGNVLFLTLLTSNFDTKINVVDGGSFLKVFSSGSFLGTHNFFYPGLQGLRWGFTLSEGVIILYNA
jgi:hypothetical protein